jgi:hypothetical protein
MAFFSAVVSLASSRDAALACFANCVICSVKVMWEKVSQKTELKSAKFLPASGGCIGWPDTGGNFYEELGKKCGDSHLPDLHNLCGL